MHTASVTAGDEQPGQGAPRGGLSFLAGFMQVLVLIGGIFCGGLLFLILVQLGLLPNPKDAIWVGAIGGPISIGFAVGLQYLVELRGDPALARPIPVAADEPGPVGAGKSIRIWLSHAGLALVGSIVIALVLGLLGVEVEEQEEIQKLVARADPFEISMLALGAVAMAPVVEELAFRHFLWRRMWWISGPAAAYVVSALLFAAIHGNPVGVLTYAWLGVVFAHSYMRSGRIWVPIAVHATNNAITLALLLAGGGEAAF